MTHSRTGLARRLLLDAGRIEKRGDNGSGAYADRDPGLSELGAALAARLFIVFLAHDARSMGLDAALKA